MDRLPKLSYNRKCLGRENSGRVNGMAHTGTKWIKTLTKIVVAVYAFCLIAGLLMLAFSGVLQLSWANIIPILYVVVYHGVIVAGCILLMRGKPLKTRAVPLIMALFLIFTKIVRFIRSLTLLAGYEPAFIFKTLGESLIGPGGVVADILLIFIVIMLYRQGGEAAGE